ncbi:hypothetical protein CHARACLAT_031284 [Characodon lateralis]|uniref:Uncharacterized protein n=1 Tax=Characodon lateralis TaxID=208331 RepID=A0ABU7FAL6_9TELE|nr:hypothetical protein [Characodon lateralis]
MFPSHMCSLSNYTNGVTPVTHRMTAEAIYAYVIRVSVPYFFSRAVRMSFASPLPGRFVACWLELQYFCPLQVSLLIVGDGSGRAPSPSSRLLVTVSVVLLQLGCC